MKNTFIKLFDHEAWANEQVLQALQTATQKNERALFLFSHILSAHSMWLCRVLGAPITCGLFDERTLAQCEELMNANYNGWKKYLSQADNAEWNRVVKFIFPVDGSNRKMTVGDAILHIFSHSAYHRGQIIAHIKGTVDTLPNTTYIVYASELNNE